MELSCDSLLKVIFTKQPLPDLVVSCPFWVPGTVWWTSAVPDVFYYNIYFCSKTGSVL